MSDYRLTLKNKRKIFMLRHIVMWKFNEGINIPRVGEEIKTSLLSLCEKMDEVVRADVIYNTLPTSTHDMILSMDVLDKAALQKYATSREHVEIADTLIKPNTNSRVAIDYMV